MRVLYTTSAWPTHYMAMVPTGWALQAAGHEVAVLCQSSQAELIGRAGLVPVPVLDGMGIDVHNRLDYYYEAVAGDWPFPWLPLHPLTGRPMSSLDDFDLRDYRRRIEPEFAARSARSFDAAVAFARAWRPDLVLHDPVSAEGLLVARVLGVPGATFLWGPTGTHEPDGPRLMPPDIGGTFARYGQDELTPDLVEYVVDPCPDSLNVPTKARRVPVRYIPYNGSGAMETWALEPPRRPRVCVTWSTALTTMSGPNSYILPKLIKALSALDVEVVVTATRQDVASLGPLPPSVRALEMFPLKLLLPTCAAVVHHGGAGTTMTAMLAGVPQLIIPFAREQAVNAQRIADAGAGVCLPGDRADADSVRSAVAALARPVSERRSNAGRLRAEALSRPTPADLVNALEALAAGRLAVATSGRT